MNEPHSSDPRLLLAELEATEHLLRTLAVENLDYAGILGVERRARTTCDGLLRRLGADPSAQPVGGVHAPPPNAPLTGNAPADPDPAPEVLVPVTRPPAAQDPVAVAEVPEFEGELEEIGEAEITDETPASSSEVLLRWNAEGRPALVEEIDDEDPTLADGSIASDVAEAEALLADEVARLQATVESEVAGAELAEPAFESVDEEPSDPVAFEDELVEPLVEAFDEPLVEEHEVDQHEVDQHQVDQHQQQVDEQQVDAPAGGDTPSWLDEPAEEPLSEEQQPNYLEEETWEDRRSTTQAPAAPAASGADPWAHLVTFSSPVAEDDEGGAAAAPAEDQHTDEPVDDPWAEQRRMERERAPVSRPPVLDPGRDALATADAHVSRADVLPDAGEPELDEIEELELEPDPPPAHTDEIAFEDDEAQTVIRAAPATTPAPAARVTPGPAASRAPRPHPRTQAGGTPIGGGTAGLYGSASSVPTIRDSDDPRPRAAGDPAQRDRDLGAGARRRRRRRADRDR
jgi:hypothetical protein